MKMQTGIWLDLRNAYIIHLPAASSAEGEAEVIHITSDIEESAATGGTRGKTPWGPQGGDLKRSAQERRHQEEKHYFENILAVIQPHSMELVIFGPSKAKHGLANAISGQEQYQPEIMGIKSADQMTQHQMVAWVRAFFKQPAKRRLPKILENSTSNVIL